jgi:membrane-associated phospholipid phosphatase
MEQALREDLAIATDIGLVILLIIPTAAVICRVYRGRHYPSDVAASFLGGFGCLWMLRRAMLTPAEQRGLPES